MKDYRFWWNFSRARISVAAVPKCGNTSLKCASMVMKRSPRDAFPYYDTQYALVRHPVDRFKSFYANKLLRQGLPSAETFQDYGDTPEEVFDTIVRRYHSGQWDNHWIPIGELLGDEFSPILVPLQHLSSILPAKPQNMTNSSEVRLSPELEDEIKDFYAQDIALWEESLNTDIDSLTRIY